MEFNEQVKSIMDNINYKVGVYASDLKGGEYSLNHESLFETASCIKVFIMIECFRQIYEGKISRNETFTYTEKDNIALLNSGIISSLEFGLTMTIKDYVILMIIISDNIATNKLIDYLGIDNINSTIKALGFNNTKLLNRLDFTKYKGLGITTPYEYSKVFEMILNGQLFNKEISNEMLDILKMQKNNEMLTKGLSQHDVLFKGTKDSVIKYIASKSGAIAWKTDEVENVRNDGGIISTNYGEYIIAIFISGFDEMYLYYNNEATTLGSKINNAIFNNFIQNKGEIRIK